MISEFIVVREGQVIVSAVSLFAFGEGLFPFLCLPERFAHLGHKPGDMPHSEAAANETLALPIYPELTEEQIRYVAHTVREFVDHA